MSHLKLVARKETTVSQSGINRFSADFPAAAWRPRGRRNARPIPAGIDVEDGLQSSHAARRAP
ncbi:MULTISPECIES: hypothetical protein [Burkholderia]|uniref:hypothetical protein n=1 Tax=Burkholderia TaxID=32008 RepID=UPI0012D8DF3D|nr:MULTISPECIES: hypothetical protein [Burkholderia]MCA7970761.1 hypothetical protein [Burkholderia sp. AU39826]